MTLTKYEYAYSAFTGLTPPHTKPNSGRLKDDIRKSTIVTAEDYIDTDDGTQACDIWFKDALSQDDQTTLDAVVAAHSGIPMTPALPVQPVKEIDVADLDSNYARTKVQGVNFSADPGMWTKKVESWPYSVDILNGEGYAGFADDGDKPAFRIVPTLVGVAVAPASQDATQIVVDDGIKALFVNKTIFPGMYLKFERGGDPQDPQGPDNPDPETDEYEIVSFDPDTNTVTLGTGLSTGISAMDLVYLVIYYGESIELQQGENVDVGGRAAGAAPVPADTEFEIWYYNVGASQKRVRLRLNYKYGPLKEE
jgi:hypothetical protein